MNPLTLTLAVVAVLVSLAAVDAPSIAAETLENGYVAVTIDPRHGGAVTAMIHKQAVRLPLIEQRGAGVAAVGRFFVPLIEMDGRRLDLGKVTMEIAPGTTAGELVLSADLKQLSPGLRIVRRFEMAENESGLRMTERLINDGAGARELTLRIGAACRFDGRPWNRSLRCWYGDSGTMRWMFTPYGRGTVSELTSKSQRPFWRVIGQYGTGFLYRPVAAAGSVRLVHRLPQQPGNPAEFEWMGEAIKIPVAREATVSSAVLVDTGGREGNNPAALLQADRMIVHGDLPAAGRNGTMMDVFVTGRETTCRAPLGQLGSADARRCRRHGSRLPYCNPPVWVGIDIAYLDFL